MLADVFSYYPTLFFNEEPSSKPWRLGSWLWASNGNVLIALADDGSEAIPTPDNRVKGRRYFEDTPEGLMTVKLSALRSFAGPPCPATLECESCHGSGRGDDNVNCEHCGRDTRSECTDCGGDGQQGIPKRYGRVVGVPVNLVLLAFALTQVPRAEDVQVGWRATPSAPHRALIIVGETWRIALMSCRDISENVPAFQASTPPVAAVDPVGEPVTG